MLPMIPGTWSLDGANSKIGPNENMNSTSVISSGTNGETSAHDLFLLSDEQILEIEAEPQDIEIADLQLDDADRAVLMEPTAGDNERARTAGVPGSRAA